MYNISNLTKTISHIKYLGENCRYLITNVGKSNKELTVKNYTYVITTIMWCVVRTINFTK